MAELNLKPITGSLFAMVIPQWKVQNIWCDCTKLKIPSCLNCSYFFSDQRPNEHDEKSLKKPSEKDDKTKSPEAKKRGEKGKESKDREDKEKEENAEDEQKDDDEDKDAAENGGAKQPDEPKVQNPFPLIS